MGGSVAVIPTAPVISIAVEEAPFYIGLGAGVREIEMFGEYIKGDTDHYNNYIGQVSAGYEINNYLAVEARYLSSIGNSYYDFSTASLYTVFRYENNTAFTPYIGGGYSWSTYDNWETTEDGLSWVMGTDYDITTNWSMFAELSYFTEPQDHVAMVGIKYNF